MADETRDADAALSAGDNVIADGASAETLSVGREAETPADAASGDRDAAVDLLLDEISGLKQERSELLSERSEFRVALSDNQAKLAGTESEIIEVAGRANRVEEQLRVTQEDLHAAKLYLGRLEEQLRTAQDDLPADRLAAVKHQDELLKLDSSVKNLQAMQVKVNDLESKIEILEEKVEVSKQKQIDNDDKLCKWDSLLSAILQEFISRLAAEKEKSKRIKKKDSKVPLMQSLALGAAAVVGAVALVAGAAASHRRSKHR